MVANVMSSTPLNISFIRALVDEKLEEWLKLLARVSNINVSQGRDNLQRVNNLQLAQCIYT